MQWGSHAEWNRVDQGAMPVPLAIHPKPRKSLLWRSILDQPAELIPYSKPLPLHQKNSLYTISDKTVFLGYHFPVTAAEYILHHPAPFSLSVVERRRNGWWIYCWHVEKFASLSVTTGIRGDQGNAGEVSERDIVSMCKWKKHSNPDRLMQSLLHREQTGILQL